MIVIVGGGISGLAIGWYLARAGRAVSVFERDAAGRGATWAAAGMLAAHVEAEPGEERLLPLLLESRAMWAEFGRDLEAASGLAVDYRDEGTLVVALDRDDQRPAHGVPPDVRARRSCSDQIRGVLTRR